MVYRGPYRHYEAQIETTIWTLCVCEWRASWGGGGEGRERERTETETDRQTGRGRQTDRQTDRHRLTDGIGLLGKLTETERQLERGIPCHSNKVGGKVSHFKVNVCE